MRSLSAPALAALSATHAVVVQLVRIDFPSGTVALNSSNTDIVYGGITFKGAYGLGTVNVIDDKPGQMAGLQLELINVDSSMVALALDSADQVQGSLVTISTAILDSGTYQVVDVETDWVGYADKMIIQEDGQKATVAMSAESKAVDMLRGQTLTYSDGDQRSLYPNDSAFKFVISQSDKPVVWPNKRWYFK